MIWGGQIQAQLLNQLQCRYLVRSVVGSPRPDYQEPELTALWFRPQRENRVA